MTRPRNIKINYLVLTVLFSALIVVVIVCKYALNAPSGSAYFDRLYSDMKDVDKREAAYYKFIQHKQKAGDYLVSRLSSENDGLLKMYALQIIGFSGCTKCEGALLKYIDDSDWHVRFFALDTLNKLGYDDIINLSKRVLLTDNNDNLVVKSLTIIGERGSGEDIVFLNSLLKDKKYAVGLYKKIIDVSLKNIKDRNAGSVKGTS